MIFTVRKKLRLQDVISGETSAKSRLITLLVILGFLLFLHSLAMFYFENMDFDDALWLSLTSVTTVGYGDHVAQTSWGRLSTVILLYILGIAILAQSATTYFDYRYEFKNRVQLGKLNWKMKNHIVFVNCPKETAEDFFYQAISGLRKSSASLSKLPIAIVSDSFKNGIPSRLQKLDVVYINHNHLTNEAIEASCLLKAKVVVILSKSRFDSSSDSINFEITDRIRDMGFKGRVIVEVSKDENRERLIKVGANNVLRPIRTYPEMLMRSILAPGAEKVLETMFNSQGEECIRYDVDINMKWFEVIVKLASKDYGIPVAYEDVNGNVINNPSPTKIIKARAIFVLIHQGKRKTDKQLSRILNSKILEKRLKKTNIIQDNLDDNEQNLDEDDATYQN